MSTIPNTIEKYLFTVDEAAAQLGLGRSKTYQLIMSGDLSSIHIGTRRLIPASAISAYIEAQVRNQRASRQLALSEIDYLIATGSARVLTLDGEQFVSVMSLNEYLSRHSATGVA